MPKATTEAIDLVEEVQEEAKEFTLSTLLPEVLMKLGLPSELDDLLFDLLPGERKYDIRRVFKRQIQRRVTAQEGRSGAEMFARAIIKQIDFHYESEVDGLSIEERHEIINVLVQNTARHFLLAADALVRYPEAARNVNLCKQKVDIRGLAHARQERTTLVEDVKRALGNAVRATVGDDNLG